MRRRHELTLTQVSDLMTSSTDFALTLVRERALQDEDEQQGRGIQIPWPTLLATGGAIAGLWSVLHQTDSETPVQEADVPDNADDGDTGLPSEVDANTDDDGSSLLDTVVNWLKGLPDAADKAMGKTVPAGPGLRSTDLGNTFMGPVQPAQDVAASYVKTGALSANVEPVLAYSVATIESRLEINASNKMTGATGLFQFLPSTWRYLIAKYRNLGFTMDDIRDPQKNAIMGSIYLKQIATSMASRLGRAPTSTEIYLGHFLGLTGGLRFIEALATQPDTLATQLFPQAARANPGVFYDGERPRTIREVWELLNGKMARAAAAYTAMVRTSGSTTEVAPNVEGDATNQKAKPAMSQTNATATPVAQGVVTTQPAGAPGILSAKMASRVTLPQTPALPSVPSLDDTPLMIPTSGGVPQVQKTYARTRSGLLISIPVQ